LSTLLAEITAQLIRENKAVLSDTTGQSYDPPAYFNLSRVACYEEEMKGIEVEVEEVREKEELEKG